MTAGLVGAWSWMGGGYGQDLVGNNHLSPILGPSYDGALGLKTASAGASYQRAVDATLKLQPPITLVWQGVSTGTAASNFATIFGVTYSSTNTSPFLAYEIGWQSGVMKGRLDWNNSGTLVTANQGLPVDAGPKRTWMAGVISPGASSLWQNESSTGFTTDGGSVISGAGVSTINYGTTPTLCFGVVPWDTTGNAQVFHEYGLIYRYALSNAQLAWLMGRGRDLFARTRGHVGWMAAIQAAQVVVAGNPAALLPAM